MQTKQQTKKVGVAGSFFNQMMGNNSSLPVVGKGATIMHYSDRSAYEVLTVNEDSSKCTIQRYTAERLDNHGMSESQEYKYERLEGGIMDIVWRQGAWRMVRTTIEYVPAFLTAFQAREIEIGHNEARKEMIEPLLNDASDLILVEGKTKIKTHYDKVSILFGVKREYYDYSF